MTTSPSLMRRRNVLAGGLAALAVPAMAAEIVRTDEPGFASVIDLEARLKTLYRDGRWCEGPCFAPQLGGLVFSDVRSNRMLVVGADDAVRAFRDPSNNANGNVLDAEGRLVTCEHRTRRVVRREPDGSLTVLAERYAGKPLNSPNDAVLGPDRSIWFTDPVFGITAPDEGLMAEPEQGACRVYRIDPSGTVQAMTDEIGQPNGIAFSPDGRILYVTDASASLKNAEGARAILAFAVRGDGRLSPKRTFAEVEAGVPDGLAVDADGRVYAACIDGIRVFAPDGRRLGRIATATDAANVAFGGADGRRLFIAAGHSVHAIDLKVRDGALRG